MKITFNYVMIIITVLIFLSTNDLSAQYGIPFNQRDDQYRLLGLKRAKEAFDFAKAEHDRKTDMYDKNLISKQEFEQAKNRFADAEVNYQQSLLAVLFEKQYVGVDKAVKYQAQDGRKHVRLTLANTSGGSAEYKKLLNIDDDLFRSLQPDIVNDVYVSLLNDDNAIISQPYEAKIEQLRYGSPVTLDFALLLDLDAVIVNIIYGNGNQRSPKIFLQKDASVNRVVLQSEQFSQEVELGKSASLDLTLELFSGTANTFKLEVVNLPQQINRYFVDPASQARLSQFKFTESTNTRSVTLQVYMPDRPSEEIVIDRPIPFYVLVIPKEQSSALGNVSLTHWQDDDIEALNAGYVRLELVPRGIGKLLVRAPQLYYSIKSDDHVEMTLELINDGSRRLDNVEIEVDAPLQWTKRIEPQLTPSLQISEEKKVSIIITPPAGISVGRYEFRIRSTSFADNRPVNGEDKSVTVEIEEKVNIFATAIIIIFIIGIIIGIVMFGIRLSRK